MVCHIPKEHFYKHFLDENSRENQIIDVFNKSPKTTGTIRLTVGLLSGIIWGILNFEVISKCIYCMILFLSLKGFRSCQV